MRLVRIIARYIALVLLVSQVLLAQSPATTVLSSSNLPILIMDTHGRQIVDSPRIIADLGIIYNGSGQRNSVTDAFNNYNGKIAIELRGSSSMAYPKKQYRFETKDALEEDEDVSLLGMPEENDWILNGPFDDKTMIRNTLVYRLSNDMGRYASRTRFCELILNDDYQGVYVLMEKIKRDKNRVDISKLNPDEIEGDDLTGGYIIKLDKTSGENVAGWTSANSIYYQYDYPKPDEIVTQQKQYIRQFVTDFEALMKSSHWNDPVTGYPAMIDLDSFVDHFILNEFARNIDGYRLSAYLYKDKDSKDGRLHAGPVWDFNLSFGKAWYPQDRHITTGWEVHHNTRLPDDSPKIPFWWIQLAHDPIFAGRVAERWSELRTGLLDKDSLNHRIDLLADTLSEARERNSTRWTEMGTLSVYQSEISYLKQWISQRIDWIDANLTLLTSIDNSSPGFIPDQYTLEQNYPNPFNAVTRIEYGIPVAGSVSIEIFDIRGVKVATIPDSPAFAGTHRVEFDATNLPAGIYIYCLKTDHFKAMKKMTLLK